MAQPGDTPKLCMEIMANLQHCFADNKDLCEECEATFADLNKKIAKRALQARLVEDGIKRVYKVGEDDTLTISELFAKGGFNNVWAGKLKSSKTPQVSHSKEYSRDGYKKESVVVKAGIETSATPCLFIDFVLTVMLEHPMILKPSLPILSVPYNRGRQSRAMVVYPRLDSDLFHLLETESFTDQSMFQIFLQIAACLEDLQSKYQFMHRDLKHTNILYRYLRVPRQITVCGVTFEKCRIEPYIIDMGMASMVVGGGVRVANDIVSADPTFRPHQDLVFYTANLITDFWETFEKKTPDFFAFLQALYSQDELLFEELQCLADGENLSMTLSSTNPSQANTSAEEDEEQEQEEEEEEEDYSEEESYDENDSSAASSSYSSKEFDSGNTPLDDKIMSRLYKLSTNSDHLTNFAPAAAIRLAKEEYRSYLADIQTFGVSSRKIKEVFPTMQPWEFQGLNAD